MAGITVSRLSFTYPQETVPALRDVSFSVEEGEFLTVIGPSGGGKSTLLRALKPALTPHGSFTGDISFFGEPLSALDARAAGRRDRLCAAEAGRPDRHGPRMARAGLRYGEPRLCHAGHPPPRGGDGELFRH